MLKFTHNLQRQFKAFVIFHIVLNKIFLHFYKERVAPINGKVSR